MDRKEQVLSMINSGLSQTKTAAKLGMSRKTVRKIIEGASTPGVLLKSKELATVQTVGKSLADFRNQYDKATIIPAKIKAALKQLGGGWEYEVDFGKIAGVTAQDLGRFRDQFAEHFVQIGRDGRRAWAGTTTTAKAMRDML
jgi:transcriptional regulator with XRE-family HTH domain